MGKSESRPAIKNRAAFIAGKRLPQSHHAHHQHEQREGHAADQGGDDGRMGGGHVLGRVDIGKHAAISGNRHRGDDDAQAREHAVDRHDERQTDEHQRHDDQAQEGDAVQARVGKRGADIAVREGSADNHHRHRGVDGADGGQRAFHRVGQPPAGQTEEQRNQRGDHTGVDQLPEVDVAAAIEQHDAVGEHEKVEHQQEHREHRHALHAIERLNDRDAHERQIGEHEQKLIEVALFLRRGHDAHEHRRQRDHQREKRDAHAEGNEHAAGRAAALQHRRNDAAGERRAQHQRGEPAPEGRRNQPRPCGNIARKHHDEQCNHLENDAGNSHRIFLRVFE